MKPAVVVGKLLRALLGLVLLLLGVAGFFTLAASYVEYPVVPSQAEGPGWVRGAFHVHTLRSDGRGTVEEVAAAAKAAGLHFVVLTDHNDLPLREPAFVDGVLMVPGVELSTAHGHLVAFGLQRPLEGFQKGMDGGEAEAAVEKAGGVSVLAHPVQKRNPWRHEEAARRADGFELYSADTFFRDAMRHPFSRLLPAVGASFGNRVHGVMLLVEPGPEPLERLLELEREKPRVALCSHDAHGLPRYEDVFRALAMYLPEVRKLPEDARAAADHGGEGTGGWRGGMRLPGVGRARGLRAGGPEAGAPGGPRGRRAHGAPAAGSRGAGAGRGPRGGAAETRREDGGAGGGGGGAGGGVGESAGQLLRNAVAALDGPEPGEGLATNPSPLTPQK